MNRHTHALSHRFSTGAAAFAAALGAFLAFSSCQSPPDDLREWKPSDHKNVGASGAMEKEAAKKGQSTGQPSMPSSLGVDQVIISTWANNCVSCHGKIGRGDGPQAALYQPKNLADPDWQSSVSDEQILTSIQRGKGKMPGFALPPETAQGLLRLVRMLGGRVNAAPATSAAPSTSAATAASDQTTLVSATSTPPAASDQPKPAPSDH